MKYEIRRIDPQMVASEIVPLWNELLPGTPPARLQWLRSNPAGEALWWLAKVVETGEVVGTVSVTRKCVRMRGAVTTFGILGDLMIAGKHQVFGPSLQLLRTALEESAALGIARIYTVPNTASSKPAQRAGLVQIGTLCHLAKPLRMSAYLSGRMPKGLALAAGKLGDWMLRLSSRETFASRRCTISESAEWPGTAAELSELGERMPGAIVSCLDASYVRWHYVDNPLTPFRLLVARKSRAGALIGFLPFTSVAQGLHIYDLLAEDERTARALILALGRIGRKEGCRALYVRLSRANPWMRALERCQFLDTKDDAPVLGVRWPEGEFAGWSFFDGDRNL